MWIMFARQYPKQFFFKSALEMKFLSANDTNIPRTPKKYCQRQMSSAEKRRKKGTKKLIKSYVRSVFTLKQQQLHVPILSVGAVFLILAGDSLIYGCYLGLIKYFNYGCKLHAFRFVSVLSWI